LNDLDTVIAAKPTIVLYGIGFRDFSSSRIISESIFKDTENIFPDPKILIRSIFPIDLNLEKNLDF